MKKFASGSILLLILCSVLLTLPEINVVQAEPKTIVVPDDYLTIHEAIDHANDGDTIFVKSGTYVETLVVNRSISLIGENRSTAVIDGNGAGTVVYVDGANNVNIVNFTIQNGDEGVIFMGGNNNTLKDNVITSQRNGVHLFFSSNNTLSGNLISNNWHGIDFDGSWHNVLRHNSLVNNRYTFEVWERYIQDIDNSNTVNGKTVYYWVNQDNKHVPSDAGYIALVNCRNITIENLNLTENGQGLLLAHTTHSTIKNVSVSRNKIGIHFIGSHSNTITNSVILNNTCAGLGTSIEQMGYQGAVWFQGSHSNILNSSTISFNESDGVKQSSSNDNSILNSTISKNGGWGIDLRNSANGILNSNLISENRDGIWLDHSSNGIITDNIVTLNRGRGIYLYNSRSATLTRNNMTRNRYNFGVGFGAVPVEPIHNVDTSNIVNGKPVYYWVNQHGRQVPADAGYVAIIESENITVSNLSFSENWQGIFLLKTNNSRIEGINATNNQKGIHLSSSFGNDISKCTVSNNYHGIVVSGSHNKLHQNTVTSNSYYGLYFGGRGSTNNRISGNTISLNRFGIGVYYSSNNTFYHNNLIDNEEQVEHRGVPPPLNTWDNGREGNYWSDYTGKDTNGDGIGDMPYVIGRHVSSYGIVVYQDNYPLSGMFHDFTVFVPPYPTEGFQHIYVISNSTVSNLALLAWLSSPNKYLQPGQIFIQFFVAGEEGNVGFCRLMIPRVVLNGSYTVLIDWHEVPVTELLISNSTHAYLYFTYDHSTHVVTIIPEFPPWTPMLLILIVLTVAISIYKRRLLKTPIH